MTLKLKISQLLTLLQNRETAKEDWLALQREGSDGQREARAKHLALDDQVEDAYHELIETLNTSRSNGLIEFDLMTLNSDETDGLRRVLSERFLLHLLELEKPEELPEMVDAWRQAAFTLEAARAIDSLRQAVAADELPAAIEAYVGRARTNQPQAWDRAVATYLALRSHLGGDEVVDAVRLDGDATFLNARRWLARYDSLTELLQTMVEQLNDSDALRFELEELETDARRALVSAMDGGLCRQRQLAPQPQVQRQWEVATMTTADEASSSFS
ncbi:hypothetical protein KF728_18725 [Candidatus Obscuribacterales bacterium]|nr:hypothetical protein [Candidatus Obscuribacterales bacterium]